MKKALKGIVKGVQIVGVGIGAAALTDPASLSAVLPPKYLPPVLATSAIINAFAPGLVQGLRKKKQEIWAEDQDDAGTGR
jgi:hypothetical protein